MAVDFFGGLRWQPCGTAQKDQTAVEGPDSDS